MRKGRTLIRGTLLLAGSGLVLRVTGVLFQTVLAARIGAAGMGLLQLILTVGGFAGTLASSGVRVAALQLVAAAWGRGDRQGLSAAVNGCLRYGGLVSCTVGTALILLARPLAAGLLQEPGAAPALRLMGLLLPVPCLCGVLHSCYTACGRLRQLVTVELLERPVSIGLTLCLLRLAGDRPDRVCTAVIAGTYGSAMLSLSLLLTGYRRMRPLSARPLGRPVLRLCIPLALNDYLRSGLGTLEQFLIPWGLSRSASRENGLAAYGTISGMVFPVLRFPEELVLSLCELLVSELAGCLARRESIRIRALVRKSLAAAMGLACLVAAGLWFGGPALGRLLFHSPMVGWYLRLFSPLVLFLYLDSVVDGLQKGMGQQLWLVRYNTLTNVIDVTGLYLLLPPWGIWGYLATYAISHLVNLFFSLRRLLMVLPEQTKPPHTDSRVRGFGRCGSRAAQ